MMIILQSPEHNIYVHSGKNSFRETEYIVIYNLQVNRFSDRSNAIHEFVRCLDHAEEGMN